MTIYLITIGLEIASMIIITEQTGVGTYPYGFIMTDEKGGYDTRAWYIHPHHPTRAFVISIQTIVGTYPEMMTVILYQTFDIVADENIGRIDTCTICFQLVAIVRTKT